MRKDIEQDIIMNMRRLRYKTIQRLQNDSEEKMVNIGAINLLYKIECHPETTQRNLAKKMFLTGSALSQWLSKLEEQGLVERKENPLDKREKLLSLTEQGKEVLKKSKEEIERVQTELFGALSMEELQQFSLLLKKIAGEPND